MAYKKVVGVTIDQTAVEAFSILDKYRLSGIAVVDKQGRLVGNTSGADLKLFVLDQGNLSLNVPILDYLSQIRLHQSSPIDIQHPSCSVMPENPLARVISKLAVTRFHRIFVVDSANHPVGVIALTDILRFATMNTDQLQQNKQKHMTPIFFTPSTPSSPLLGPMSPSMLSSLSSLDDDLKEKKDGRRVSPRNSPQSRPRQINIQANAAISSLTSLNHCHSYSHGVGGSSKAPQFSPILESPEPGDTPEPNSFTCPELNSSTDS